MTTPNYKRIYKDILQLKYPEKKEKCVAILKKERLSALDIINLNNLIFPQQNKESQKLRSYGSSDIIQILNYQKKYNLNNAQVANHFRLSRNTVAKWKKIF